MSLISIHPSVSFVILVCLSRLPHSFIQWLSFVLSLQHGATLLFLVARPRAHPFQVEPSLTRRQSQGALQVLLQWHTFTEWLGKLTANWTLAIGMVPSRLQCLPVSSVHVSVHFILFSQHQVDDSRAPESRALIRWRCIVDPLLADCGRDRHARLASRPAQKRVYKPNNWPT